MTLGIAVSPCPLEQQASYIMGNIPTHRWFEQCSIKFQLYVLELSIILLPLFLKLPLYLQPETWVQR